MQIKYQQTTRTGCGSYALANLFNDERYIQDLPDDYQRIYDLQRLLDANGAGMFIDPLFITSPHFTLGSWLMPMNSGLFAAPEGYAQEDLVHMCKPYLLTIAHQTKRTLHMVGLVHHMGTGAFYFIDSGRAEVKKYTIVSDILQEMQVVGVHQFGIQGDDNPGSFAMIDKSFFAHILGPGE